MNTKLRFGFLVVLLASITVSSNRLPQLSVSQILNLINQDRMEHGLKELNLNSQLNLAAMAKLEDMVTKNYFGHESPEGTKPWYWFRVLGYNYSYAGENLAEGYSDPYDLVNSWMSSPGHRANILSPFYSEVGLAVVNVNNNSMVVQFFGSPDSKLTLRQY